jgi:hypothetical protein
VTKYKLLDYPHCAICEYSEQYQDDTFICTISDDPDNPDDPLPFEECGDFTLCKIYLVSFIIRLTEMIKKIRKDQKGD